MKNLKKEARRILSLLVAVAVVAVSAPQEFLTVRAAEVSETSEDMTGAQQEYNAPEAMKAETGGKEETTKETEKTEETEEKEETKTKETNAAEKEETETKETNAAETPETETKGTSAAETPETETKGSSATETPETETKTESSGTETGTEPEPAPAEEETGSETLTTEEETTEESETEETETDLTEEETDTEEETKTEETDVAEKNPAADSAGGVPAVDRDKKLAKGYGYDTMGNENTNVEWFLDQNGTLEVTGTGEVCRPTLKKRPPWYEYLSDVKAARINLKGAVSAYDLFEGCSNLTQVDLSGFDTKNLKSTEYMFENCTSLTNLDLSGFDISNVTSTYKMFYGCSSLEEVRLNGLGSVTKMEEMFCGCSSLEEVCLDELGSVTSMKNMFRDCSSLKALNLSSQDAGKKTDMNGMFYNCSSLEELNLSGLDTSSVTDMSYMFYGCSALTELGLSGLNTSSVSTMRSMFYGCSSLEKLDLSGLNISSVSTMQHMFNRCSALNELNLSGLDTSSVTDMSYMFYNCGSLEKLDLRGLNTSSVTTMESMFQNCSSLKEPNLTGWNTDKLKNVYDMFGGCSALESLDLSSLNLNNLTSYSRMFTGCSNLTSITQPANLTRSGITLPEKTGISWRRPEGRKETTLVTSFDEPLTLTSDRAGIQFTGGNYALEDAGGNPVKLVNSSTSGTKGETLVDIGSKEKFVFTVVPEEGYTVKAVTLESGEDSTSAIVLEKGTQPNQYTITPADPDSGYTRDETIKIETVEIAKVTMSVTYDSIIDDVVVFNGTSSSKEKPASVQVSNDADTAVFVKLKASRTGDLQEPLLCLMKEETINKIVEYGQDTAALSAEQKALVEKGYHYFPLGGIYEETSVRVTGRYVRAEDDIAGDRVNNVWWLIDKDGRLKVKGEGEMYYSGLQPWNEYRERITSAVVEWTGASQANYLFYGCVNMQEADLGGLDADGMTGLHYAFYNCRSLTALDLSNIDAQNMVNVGHMLEGCNALEEIKTPLNMRESVSLPNPGSTKWRTPDGTAVTELPQNQSESITITTRLTAISFTGEAFTIKDSSGNLAENGLLARKGTKEPVVFTAEAQDGYVVKNASADWSDSMVTVTAGKVSGQYIVTPKDTEKGYEKDELIRIETVPVEYCTMDIRYDNRNEIEDIVVYNGSQQVVKGKPDSAKVSNAQDTTIYVKVGKTEKEGTWIPKLRLANENKILTHQTDTASMSEKDREMAGNGYYVFPLGRLFDYTSVTVALTTFYQVGFSTKGFPGNVRIIRYVEDTGEKKWLGEEVKETIAVEAGEAFYIQAAWDDTPDAAHKRCFVDFESDAEIYVEKTTLEGVDGDVYRLRVNENASIQAVLKPKTISLDYAAGDLSELGVNAGARLSGDQKSVELYGGDSLSLTFTLGDGLEISGVSDDTGAMWGVSGENGKYTVTIGDMERLLGITTLKFSVHDSKNRISLSDPESISSIAVKFRGAGGSTTTPVYTGEAFEAYSIILKVLDMRTGRKRIVTLKKDKDYTVSYANNVNAGEASLIITAMPDSADYRGTYVYNFQIAKAAAPYAQYKTIQVENKGAQATHQLDLAGLFKMKDAKGKEISPTGYRLKTPCDKGEVLDAEPVLDGNILTYTVRGDADENSQKARLIIHALYDNYEDWELQASLQVVKKQKLVLGGTVTVSDKTYDGMEIQYNVDGLQILSVEGTSEPAGADLLKEIKNSLSYHYTGTNGTVYNSSESPMDIGTYKVQVQVSEENLHYKSDYMDVGSFQITPRAVRVIADDVRLYVNDTLPTQYGYRVEGLAEGDIVTTKPLTGCGIQSTKEPTGENPYPVTVSISAMKIANRDGRDVTANYNITGQDGRLEVCEPEPGSYIVTYRGADLLNPEKEIVRSGNEAGKLIEKPADPAADGYVFLGWYTDEALSKTWNFDTDILLDDITLYAGWAKEAAKGEGVVLCVQEILPQTYTGTALKPAVTVYASDGKTLLKNKTHYTVAYKNNTNADVELAPDAPQGGVGENINDDSQGFNKNLPYVIITGKGNYTGKIYVNFKIQKADISAAGTSGSGFTLKYTDQFEQKAGKSATVVTQFKYKKNTLKYNKDYTLTVEKKDGDVLTPVSLNTKGQIPLDGGGEYQLTITGTGNNYTGKVIRTLQIADKTLLLKNAKITGVSGFSNVTREDLKNGLEPAHEKITVKLSGKTLEEGKDYTIKCTDKNAIGTATLTIEPAEGSAYIGSKSVTYKIKGTAFKANALQPFAPAEMTYTGKAQTQNGIVITTKDGTKLEYGADYTVSYKNNIKKGKATMTFKATPASGYSGSFSKTFKINALDLNDAVAGDTTNSILLTGAEETESGWRLPESEIYRKGGVTPADKVSLRLNLTGTTLTVGKGKDYTITYSGNKAAGPASMTLKGSGNYTGSLTIYFDIEKASLAGLDEEGLLTVTAPSPSVSFAHIWEETNEWVDNGDHSLGKEKEDKGLRNPNAKFSPAVTIKDGGTALKKNTDYTVEYSNNTRKQLEDEGTIRATITGMGNYSDSEDDVIEFDIEVNVKRISFTDNGRVKIARVDDCIYTGEGLTPEVSVTYTPREYDDETETWGNGEPETLSEGEDYQIVYSNNIAKGTGKIKIVGIGSYSGSKTTTFKITSKPIYSKPQPPADPDDPDDPDDDPGYPDDPDDPDDDPGYVEYPDRDE